MGRFKYNVHHQLDTMPQKVLYMGTILRNGPEKRKLLLIIEFLQIIPAKSWS